MGYPKLFSPFQIRNVELRNRVAISGHHALWWVDKGLPSDDFVAYIEARAKGGVGLFTIGCTSPLPGSGWLENVNDDVIPRYRACADAAHRHGTKLFAQICHPGYGPLPGPPLWTSVPKGDPIQPFYKAPDRYEMTLEDIDKMVKAHGAAARRIAEGGADGVELHAHEWFLAAQFLNPQWNRRTDHYGGSLENRMRFVVECLQTMRENVGPDLVVGIRLKTDEMAQRGNTEDDYAEIVRRLESAKLIDYVLFTGGDTRHHHGPMGRPEMEWVDMVARHRQRTALPVMHAGRIVTPSQAEAALEADAMDIVVMTKSHIADPNFVQKAADGREEDIRVCTRCLQVCHGQQHRMTCVYNPMTSRELMWANTTTPNAPRRIVIVGAGPCGMECAIVAKERGHEVIVLEQSDKVGGQVWLGASSPLRTTWGRIGSFYAAQARKMDVRLNTRATRELIESLKPDCIVLATGSRPVPLQGTLTVHQALSEPLVGKTLVIDREGTMRPWVVVDLLSSQGQEVAFATTMTAFAPNTDFMVAEEFVRQFEERQVTFYPRADLVEWDGQSARLRDPATAEEFVLSDIRQVVVAQGSIKLDNLARELRHTGIELHVIGDANTPSTMDSATFQGHRLGRLL